MTEPVHTGESAAPDVRALRHIAPDWTDPLAVEVRIDIVEQTPPWAERFTPTRYPYTYAYDYMRAHAAEFGLSNALSRADCAGIVRGENKEEVVRLLADAYLREHRIPAPHSGSSEIPTQKET